MSPLSDCVVLVSSPDLKRKRGFRYRPQVIRAVLIAKLRTAKSASRRASRPKAMKDVADVLLLRAYAKNAKSIRLDSLGMACALNAALRNMAASGILWTSSQTPNHLDQRKR